MITVYVNADSSAKAGDLYQWDYGQLLKIEGVELPESYEVHFATSGMDESISVTGDNTGVEIPNELLESGNNIRGWVYIKTEDTGTTKYSFILKVIKRAKPTDPRPEIIPAEGVEF